MTRHEPAPNLTSTPGLRPAAALGRRQDVTGEQMPPTSEPDVEPAVTIRAVLDLIQAEREEAAARCPTWRTCTAAEYVAGNYQLLGANDVLGRLEVAVLRLREEVLRCPPRS